MPKVLISDKLSPRAVEIFRERGIEADVQTGLDPDALRRIIGEYDGLAIRSATKVTPKLLEAADRLKVVGRAGIGVDNVDIPAATARGIIVMNTPFGNSITTGEALSEIGTNTASPDSARSRAAFSVTIELGMPSLSRSTQR